MAETPQPAPTTVQVWRLVGWALVAVAGAALLYACVFVARPAPLPRPGLLIGFVATVVGLLNVHATLFGRRDYVPPEPGGRFWA